MKNLFLFLFVCLLSISCSDLKFEEFNGTMRDLGPIEVDGCGWVLEKDNGEQFKVHGMHESLKNEGMKITFTYSNSDQVFLCGLQGDTIPFIYMGEYQKVYN
jgi:hypothetical protein